jgi:hypothetical protein
MEAAVTEAQALAEIDDTLDTIAQASRLAVECGFDGELEEIQQVLRTTALPPISRW